MDINYELYKVFYYVAFTSQLFRSFQASVHLPVCRQPVHQDAGTQTGPEAVYPQYQTGSAYSGRRDLTAPYRTCHESDPARGSTAYRRRDRPEDRSASAPVTPSAVISWSLTWNVSTRNFPHVHIKVLNQTSIRCVELLETGQVDLIVVNYPNSYLSNVSSIQKIRTFQDIFIANQAFSELKDRKLYFQRAFPVSHPDAGSQEYHQ